MFHNTASSTPYAGVYGVTLSLIQIFIHFDLSCRSRRLVSACLTHSLPKSHHIIIPGKCSRHYKRHRSSPLPPHPVPHLLDCVTQEISSHLRFQTPAPAAPLCLPTAHLTGKNHPRSSSRPQVLHFGWARSKWKGAASQTSPKADSKVYEWILPHPEGL